MAKRFMIQNPAGILAFTIFTLVCAVSAVAQMGEWQGDRFLEAGIPIGVRVPDQARAVLGHGYDMTGLYAHPQEVRWPVLDMDRLIASNRVMRNPNVSEGEFITVSGRDISEYTSELAARTGLGISGGFSLLSFSREVESRFNSERTTRSEYEFATMSSIITRDAYFIRNHGLEHYVNQFFINDVNNMTPEQLISRYGTHVMLGALLGARLDHNISARRTRQTSTTSIASLVTTSFDVRFRGVGGGANVERELQNRFGQEFDISSIEIRTRAVGGSPEWAQSVHNNQDYNAWIASIAGNVVWNGYYRDSLVPLYEFIFEQHFGVRTQTIRGALRNAIYSHLGISYIDLDGFGDPISVPAATLADGLTWLQTNARNNNHYVIELNRDETIAPRTLAFPNRNNVAVTLRGTGAMRTINLSDNGSLLTVGSGVTLILDDNITLRGRVNDGNMVRNNSFLVTVNNGGFLIMNEGTWIRSNWGGGLRINPGGTFTMNGGRIFGNRGLDGEDGSDGRNGTAGRQGTSSNRNGGNGGRGGDGGIGEDGTTGGVHNAGTFTMNGGEISRNRGGSGGIGGRGGNGGRGGDASGRGNGGSGGSGGTGGTAGNGGIGAVANFGAFIMHGGIIASNNGGIAGTDGSTGSHGSAGSGNRSRRSVISDLAIASIFLLLGGNYDRGHVDVGNIERLGPARSFTTTDSDEDISVGGVFNAGTIQITNGIIYGVDAAENLRNTGGALLFSEGAVRLDNLSDSANTIRVVNGIVQ